MGFLGILSPLGMMMMCFYFFFYLLAVRRIGGQSQSGPVRSPVSHRSWTDLDLFDRIFCVVLKQDNASFRTVSRFPTGHCVVPEQDILTSPKRPRRKVSAETVPPKPPRRNVHDESSPPRRRNERDETKMTPNFFAITDSYE